MPISRSAGWVAVTLLGLSLLMVGGCEEDTAFYIIQNQVPEPGCQVSTSETVYRAEGLLDVSAGEGYHLFPLLHNALPAASTGSSSRPDRNLLQLKEFKVRLDLGGLGLEENRFSHPTSGLLFPGARRSSDLIVIPAELVRTLQGKIGPAARPLVMVEVVAVAESGDRDVVESLPFHYPVTLCSGCLVLTMDSCPGSSEDLAGIRSNECGIPQDTQVACCRSAGSLRCFPGQ